MKNLILKLVAVIILIPTLTQAYPRPDISDTGSVNPWFMNLVWIIIVGYIILHKDDNDSKRFN